MRPLTTIAAVRSVLRHLVVLIALLAGARIALAQASASFSFPEDPAYLVLEYHQSHDMLPATDPVPLLRIYGDGRVLVHQPVYRVDAGDYELRLSPAELRDLLAGLAQRNVPRANVADLARARRREDERRLAEQGTVFAVSDATVTHLTLHLESFTPAAGARAISNLSQRIVWPNLQSDAERFPEVSELAELAAAERELQALVGRSDRRKLR